MKKTILFCGIVMLLFVGCGGSSSDDDAGNNNGDGGGGGGPGLPGGSGSGDANPWPLVFVKPADLDAGQNLIKYSKSDVVYFMNDEDFYVHKSKKNSEKSDDLFSCFEEKSQNIKYKADGDFLYINEEIDFSECEEKLIVGRLNRSHGNQDLKIEEQAFTQNARFYTMVRCEGGNFKQFNGKTIKEASEMTNNWDENYVKTLCPDEGKREALSNSRMNIYYKYSYSYMEKSTRVSKTEELEDKSISVQMTLKARPCVENVSNGIATHEDGCVSVKKSQRIIDKENDVANEEMGTEAFSRIEYKGITSSIDPSAIWYSSGEIRFQKGDWTGTVTYTDKATAPTYNITNGTESAEGQLSSSF